jgi:hypothetical protein
MYYLGRGSGVDVKPIEPVHGLKQTDHLSLRAVHTLCVSSNFKQHSSFEINRLEVMGKEKELVLFGGKE